GRRFCTRRAPTSRPCGRASTWASDARPISSSSGVSRSSPGSSSGISTPSSTSRATTSGTTTSGSSWTSTSASSDDRAQIRIGRLMTGDFPTDIFTEPSDVDPDTLRNLGPLTPLAGIWEGRRGLDVHPVAEGTEQDGYLERYELQPIDPQTNGPQLLYGLPYHTHVLRPHKPATFHPP